MFQAVDHWIELRQADAERSQNGDTILRLKRDRSMLLLGFWRGFRGDEPLAMEAEYVDLRAGIGMAWMLPWTKTDRLQGTDY